MSNNLFLSVNLKVASNKSLKNNLFFCYNAIPNAVRPNASGKNAAKTPIFLSFNISTNFLKD